MPVKTEKTPAPAVDYSGMNICRKLQIARLKFLQAGVKKTGKNIHLEFMYFELADIVPVAEAIFTEVGLLMVPTFGKEYAVAKVFNCDDRDEEPMAAFIKINGREYPCPRRGLNLMTATIVDSARNANAVVVGQVVGREQQKLDRLEWAYLTAEQWSSILKEFKNFYVTVTYPDMVNNTWTTRKMYPGDRTAEPFHLDPVTQLPIDYINCKVNLIDCGEPF